MRRTAGFALVLVLWVIAGLSVIAAAVSQNAGQSAQATQTFADRALAERAFSDARAKMLFTLGTSGVVQNGRRVGDKLLRVDDHPYRTGTNTFVSLQDARGLFNLNSLRPEDGERLLRGCGVAPSAIAALLDALTDYIDPDDLKSLNGAEAPEYLQAGQQPPPNRPLMRPTELWNVFGWDRHRIAWEQNNCQDLVATTDEFGFNYVTAPLAALVAKGFAPELATALVAERNIAEGQIANLTNNYARYSLSDNPFGGNTLARPGRAYRVRHWHANGASLQYWVVQPLLRREPPWVVFDHTWAWKPAYAQQRSTLAFPQRTPADLTEDALAPTSPFPFR